MKFICEHVSTAVKQFGLLLHAGSFMPEFKKSHKGLVIDVSCTEYSYQFETWYVDTIQDRQEFTKIKFIAVYSKSNGAMTHGRGASTAADNSTVEISLPLTGDMLVDTLRTIYKLENFRPFQKEIIQSIQDKRHTLAVMPTGSGKTLCFTLPAILSTGHITFAIFPLNSLLIDMFNHFSQIFIPCCMVNQYSSKESTDNLLHDLSSENPQTKIVLITPESLQRPDFQKALNSLSMRKLLSFIAIDEMHAIVESSHDYRRDYRKLSELKQYNVPILGLTATATAETLSSITKVLNLDNPQVFKAPAWRSNLVIQVINKKNKEKVFEEIEKYIDNDFKGQCGIIYCLHQTDVMDVSYRLTHKDEPVSVAIYFGQGLDQESRTTSLNNWLAGRSDVLIATKSAGTGINKPDVRFVFQIGWPESVEEYFQQIGRAGRDNQTSVCILFPQSTNKSFHLKHLVKNEEESFRLFGISRLHKMAQYVQHLRCRKRFICHYFRDQVPQGGDCNNSCDNCINKQRYRELPVNEEIRKFVQCLQSISLIQKEPSIDLVMKTFVGSKAKVVSDAGLNLIHEHGIGTGVSTLDAENLIYVAVHEEILKEVVPYNRSGKAKLSYLSLGKNAMSMLCGEFFKQLSVDRK